MTPGAIISQAAAARLLAEMAGKPKAPSSAPAPAAPSFLSEESALMGRTAEDDYARMIRELRDGQFNQRREAQRRLAATAQGILPARAVENFLRSMGELDDRGRRRAVGAARNKERLAGQRAARAEQGMAFGKPIEAEEEDRLRKSAQKLLEEAERLRRTGDLYAV